jgi:hypothetical protein
VTRSGLIWSWEQVIIAHFGSTGMVEGHGMGEPPRQRKITHAALPMAVEVWASPSR